MAEAVDASILSSVKTEKHILNQISKRIKPVNNLQNDKKDYVFAELT